MDEYFQYLETLHPLSAELKAALVGRIHKETYRKNRPLLSAGDTSNWIAFVEKGFCKQCYDSEAGQERIIAFIRPNEITTSLTSYYQVEASHVDIVALEDTTVRKLYKRDADAIAEKYPCFHKHLQAMIAQISAQLELHSMLMATPAKERVNKIPAWISNDKRIKEYMIADYLGIHRNSLHRLNKEL